MRPMLLSIALTSKLSSPFSQANNGNATQAQTEIEWGIRNPNNLRNLLQQFYPLLQQILTQFYQKTEFHPKTNPNSERESNQIRRVSSPGRGMGILQTLTIFISISTLFITSSVELNETAQDIPQRVLGETLTEGTDLPTHFLEKEDHEAQMLIQFSPENLEMARGYL